MRKIFVPIVCSLMMLMTACGGSSSTTQPAEPAKPAESTAAPAAGNAEKKTVKIGITQIVEHPSLDAAREGFLAGLKDGGYVEGENLKVDIQIAQGDMNNNTTIAQKFAADKVDLILAIATPSAQAAAQATSDIPIFFTAITDPLGAKLVGSLEQPGKNVTGTSDTHPEAIPNTVKTIKEFFPDAKNVGVIYNSGEQNSVVNVENAKKVMQEQGLTAVEATASNSSEVKQAVESLVGRVDVIYVPKDNTAVSALESVTQVANQNKIPMFVGEMDSVKRGGFAGFGFEYYDLGYTTAKMAMEVLDGSKKPADIPVGFPEELNLVINKKAAEAQGVTLTEAMTSKAVMVE
ncbi:ABC transporter substrate-binding protein [Ammoniphilus sp. CFH 90114]|uniref:ABC transporter substrate-binding protein n=1 Tax=Ammoniphilus sp. CFH 90114 TaxID=2493665 RepID=UPI001F0BD66D|nr:ABC transporter substrate-binding protein [Ammoniphilus sp. CFH 90114]